MAARSQVSDTQGTAPGPCRRQQAKPGRPAQVAGGRLDDLKALAEGLHAQAWGQTGAQALWEEVCSCSV